MAEPLSKPALSAAPTALSVRDQVLAQISTGYSGPRAFRMWLPPLTFPTALDTIVGRDRSEHPHHTHLRIPMGIIDNPREHSQRVWSIELSGPNANAAIGGGKQTGKSTLLLTMLMSAALTHSPRDLQFYCLDFSANLLLHVEELPHVGGVATALDPPRIRRIVAELVTLLNSRRDAFNRHRVVDMDAYRRLRADSSHPLFKDPFGDVVLIVDGWTGLKDEPEFEPLVEKVKLLAEQGPGFGIHVVITTTRWTDLRANIRDLLGLKVELYPASTDDTVLTENRRAVKSIPKLAGRAMSNEYLHLMIAAPRLDGQNSMDGIGDTYPRSCDQIKEQWAGFPPAPPVRTLPSKIHIDDILRMAPGSPADTYAKRWSIPVGLAESTMQPAIANLAEFPHVLIFGDNKAGRTSALRSVVKAILSRNNDKQVAFVVIDYRATLLGLIPESYLLPTLYIRHPGDLERAAATRPQSPGQPPPSIDDQLLRTDPVELIAKKLATRRPPPNLKPEQLLSRSWWSGYDIVLLIDNWEMVVQSHSAQISALQELTPFVNSATDVGFHVVAACHMKEANKVLSRGIIGAAYAYGSNTILLSGDKMDFPSGREFTVTARPRGQGLYRTVDGGLDVVQAAFCEPIE